MKTIKLSALLITGLFLAQSTVAQSTERASDSLRLSIQGHEFRIGGGTAGGRCALLVGTSLQSVQLPGGATLLVQPQAIMAMGEFDARGEFRLTVGYDAKMLAPIRYHFQAIAADRADGALRVSELRTLDFTDLQHGVAVRNRDGEVIDGEVIDGEVIDGDVDDGVQRAERAAAKADGRVPGEVIDGEVIDGDVDDGVQRAERAAAKADGRVPGEVIAGDVGTEG